MMKLECEFCCQRVMTVRCCLSSLLGGVTRNRKKSSRVYCAASKRLFYFPLCFIIVDNSNSRSDLPLPTFRVSSSSSPSSAMVWHPFQQYVYERCLLRGHRLQNCTLVIDGHILMLELYDKFRARHNDTRFGGDYASFALYIESFFEALNKCRVKPVVVMSRSFGGGKPEKKLARYKNLLVQAKRIYEGKRGFKKGMLPRLCFYMFAQIIQKRKIAVVFAILNKRETLSAIARDLNAFLLSSNWKYMLEVIPAGVIHPKSLLRGKFCVKGQTSNRPNLWCQLYRFSCLLELFPGLNEKLAPIIDPLFGINTGRRMTHKLIDKLPQVEFFQGCTVPQVHSALSWLATQSSPNAAKDCLVQLFGANHPVVGSIEELITERQRTPLRRNVRPIKRYIEVNFGSDYFENELHLPAWTHAAWKGMLTGRLFSLFHDQVFPCRPLIEDLALTASSYEATFEMCDYIFGLLRCTNEAKPKVVTRYVRVGEKFSEQSILPKTKIADDRLPLLEEIAFLAHDDRLALFYRILGFRLPLSDDLKGLLTTSKEPFLTQFETLLLSTVYLSHHFSADLWIEFLYALLVNILFMGYYSEANTSIPKLLDLSSSEAADQLVTSLKTFDKIPTITSANYQARIVHQYNAWQNCLKTITILACTLNLAHIFHANTLVCGLQGSFIYNLTVELAKQPAPLTYLKETLLGPLAFSLFEPVLRLVLEHSQRSFLFDANSAGDEAGIVILPNVAEVHVRSSEPSRYLVRSSIHTA